MRVISIYDYTENEYLDGVYNEVAVMFRDLIKEILPTIASDSGADYGSEVTDWYEKSKDIYLVIADNEDIAGFYMGAVYKGFCKPHYVAEHCYVKPRYRNTKAAYLLYNKGAQRAKELGLTLITNAYLLGNNKVDSIVSKFAKPLFTQYIREVENGRQ
ncbi:MAG: GNAT family N-acetyltransferase [Campylobacteraceae bacterium]|jgi:GNAT superfamily N-acetyltransferase|nr:GNAT family N-acetyltransferase [Campylobacteraceae bacterium]